MVSEAQFKTYIGGQKLFSINFLLRTQKKNPCVVVILSDTLCHASGGEATDCVCQASTYSPRAFNQHLIRQIVLLAESIFSFVGPTFYICKHHTGFPVPWQGGIIIFKTI